MTDSSAADGIHLQLARTLEGARRNAGISIDEVARRLWWSKDKIENIEAGVSPPSKSNLEALARDVYGLPPEDVEDLVNLLRNVLVQNRATVARQVAEAAVFISYRRSDQPALAGRMYDKLSGYFGGNRVFMDVDSIALGLDFVEVLNETLSNCSVLIAVIGRDWLNACDEEGNRRLDQTDDFVRAEIETALRRNIRVIPILVDGTHMPKVAQLPESISALSRRNGRDIWNARFNSDCMEIISTLEEILRTQTQVETPVGAPQTKPQPGSGNRVYSSNGFNVEVATAIQQTWFDCFGDRTHMRQARTRSDGGVDGIIWPLELPGTKVAFKTFPSPDTKLRSYVAEKSLAGMTEPCLIVTRLELHPGTRAMIENAYPHPIQFLRWSGSGDGEELEIRLRILKDAATTQVSSYVEDVLRRVSMLANALSGDELIPVRRGEISSMTSLVMVMAPSQRLNADFAVKVISAEDQDVIYKQVDVGKKWMRDRGLPGIIVVREHPGEKTTSELQFDGNERHIQLLLWRDPRDDESMKQALNRVTIGR